MPAIEPIVAALRGEPRDTGLSTRAPAQARRVLRVDRAEVPRVPRQHEAVDHRHGRADAPDPGRHVQQHGGAAARRPTPSTACSDVYEELPRTRRELGYPPLVTPTSQIVGTQAVLNVLFGRYKMISREVKDYVVRPLRHSRRRRSTRRCRSSRSPGTSAARRRSPAGAADLLEPELDKARADTAGLARDIGDVLCYALYPTTGLRFLKWKYGVEAPPPETKAEDARRRQARGRADREGEEGTAGRSRHDSPPARPAAPRRVAGSSTSASETTGSSSRSNPKAAPPVVTAASERRLAPAARGGACHGSRRVPRAGARPPPAGRGRRRGADARPRHPVSRQRRRPGQARRPGARARGDEDGELAARASRRAR